MKKIEKLKVPKELEDLNRGGWEYMILPLLKEIIRVVNKLVDVANRVIDRDED